MLKVTGTGRAERKMQISWFPAQRSCHPNRLLQKSMESSEVLREHVTYLPAMNKLKWCQLKSHSKPYPAWKNAYDLFHLPIHSLKKWVYYVPSIVLAHGMQLWVNQTWFLLSCSLHFSHGDRYYSQNHTSKHINTNWE